MISNNHNAKKHRRASLYKSNFVLFGFCTLVPSGHQIKKLFLGANKLEE